MLRVFCFLWPVDFVRQPDLVRIELHARMVGVEWDYLFNTRMLVINEYLKINGAQEIQIYLVLIVPDRHDICSVLIKEPYFLIERQFIKFNPGDHAFSLSKNRATVAFDATLTK